MPAQSKQTLVTLPEPFDGQCIALYADIPAYIILLPSNLIRGQIFIILENTYKNFFLPVLSLLDLQRQ